MREPTCARLQVYADEERLPDVRLPLGRPCRPPARIREAGCEDVAPLGAPDACGEG